MRAQQAALALAGALTTWVATWGWRGFTVESASWLASLLVLALLVAGVGALARWARLPGLVVVAVQLASGALATLLVLGGSLVPSPTTLQRALAAVEAAAASAQEYAAPVPAGAPSIGPLLVLGGLGCLVAVDLLAGTLRRPALAGLPLLTAYALPVSMLGTGAPWPVFALVGAGWLLMLALQEDDRVERWGRGLASDGRTVLGRPVAARAGAAVLGGGVTLLALVVPVAAPSAGLTLFEGGFGPGGDGEIELDDPMVDLRRDLRERDDVPLVRVNTDDPDPDYLRITVLERFSENAWTSGGRDLPDTQRADGTGLPATGVDSEVAVASETYGYTFSATEAFRSQWLPTPFPARAVEAPGVWKYDLSTLDVLAADDDGGLDTAGLTWTATGLDPAFDEAALDDALPGGDLVDPVYTELPELPPVVTALAEEVTRGADGPLAQAKALQQFFRVDGDFQYSLEADTGNGGDELEEFLTDDEDGRTGYCEQFASAMAVMARSLGIPARVAMGFLEPTEEGRGQWVYSTDDLHAWPELYFAGQGWVRFEPTPGGPGGRAQTPPPWSTGEAPDPVTAPEQGGVGADPLDPDRNGAPSPAPAPETDTAGDAAAETGGGSSWGGLAVLLAVLLVVAALALAPRWLRRRRTEAAWAAVSAGEAAPATTGWRELQDGCRDLGVAWPGGLSPSATHRALLPALASGPVAADDALARLVARLEQEWYAAPVAGAGGDAEAGRRVRDDVELVLEAAADGVRPRARALATWLPRSVLGRRRVEPVLSGGLLDRVG